MQIHKILEERGKNYGDFKQQAVISQALKSTMFMSSCGRVNLNPSQIEALEMIFVKIARILNGNPNYKDNWVDIAGYATLVANILEREQEGK